MTAAFHRMRQLLERWSALRGSFDPAEDALDRATFGWVVGPIGDRWRGLWLLAARGHDVDLTFQAGAATYTLSLGQGGPGAQKVSGVDALPPGGLASLGLNPAQTKKVVAAKAKQDWYSVLRLLAAEPACQVTIRLRNDPGTTGEHWIRRAAVLPPAPVKDHWLTYVRELTQSAAQPVRLRVEDATSEWLIGPGLVVFGPGAVGQLPAPPPQANQKAANAYAASRLVDNRSGVPEPTAVIVQPGSPRAAHLCPFGMWLRQTAHALLWVWLASEMHIDRTTGEVRVRFDQLEFQSVDAAFDAFDTSDEAAAAVKDLFTFAVGSDDSLRREAVLGAVSTLLPATTPLNTARPSDIKSRARQLQHLAERGRLSEATASLRAAQTAGFTTARAIGDGTRAAARSAMERVFIQVIAAIGIISAQATDAFPPEVALVLLLGVLAVTFGISAVAFRYEYPAAESLHSAFVIDLKIQSKDLPKEDRKAVAGMEALTSSSTTLERSMRWVEYVVVAGAAFCMIGIVAMWWAWLGSRGLVLGLAFAALFTIVAWAWRPRIAPELRGNCPVRFVELGTWVEGDRAFITTQGCRRYVLADHQAQLSFAEDPKGIARQARQSWKRRGPVADSATAVVDSRGP